MTRKPRVDVRILKYRTWAIFFSYGAPLCVRRRSAINEPGLCFQAQVICTCFVKIQSRASLMSQVFQNLIITFSAQKCDKRYKTRWTNDNSLLCNDGRPCTRNDRCSSGKCIGTAFTCLSCEECYNDACRVKPGYCAILVWGSKTCFSHRNLRPYYPCQVTS